MKKIFWKIWELIIFILLIAFVGTVILYDCNFIYHTDFSGFYLIRTQIGILIIDFIMTIIYGWRDYKNV